MNLVPLLEPRSVAVVGASARAGSFGDQLVGQLLGGGYQGTVQLVNPRYREVAGRPCHRSLEELPGPVDLAVLAVPNAALEAQLRAAAGIPAAVIFASCVDAEPDQSGGTDSAPPDPPNRAAPLVERLAAIARGAGMAVCGGNGMGFFNLEQSLRVCGYPEPPDLAPGLVAVISHSGSVFSALLHNDRGLRFNLVVSAGNELVTSAAAYLDPALELPSTRVVALFLETVREPEAFRAALAKAAARAVPVVALTVGRGQAARAMVAAHSGALAGSDGAYQALFDAYGVAWVASLDELADTCELLAAGRRAAPAGWPPSTTPAASGPTCRTWPSGCGCRWPRSRPRPGSGWRPCWSPAYRPPTRWMPGVPATTPTRSSPAASGLCSRTRMQPPLPSTWTSPPSRPLTPATPAWPSTPPPPPASRWP